MTHTTVRLAEALATVPGMPRDPKARAALSDLASRVMAGEFDASKEESDAWMASPEGQDTLRQLGDDAAFSRIIRDMKGGKRHA